MEIVFLVKSEKRKVKNAPEVQHIGSTHWNADVKNAPEVQHIGSTHWNADVKNAPEVQHIGRKILN